MWIYTSMYISNDSGQKSKTVIVLTLLFQDIFYSNLSLPLFSPPWCFRDIAKTIGINVKIVLPFWQLWRTLPAVLLIGFVNLDRSLHSFYF